MKKRIKVNALIIFATVILTLIFPKVFFRPTSQNIFITGLEMFGVSFILFGQLIRVSSRGYKSEHSQSGHALATGGPYALVRNPMYLGVFFIGLGILSCLFRFWVIILFLIVFIVRYIFLIYKEEEKLLKFFGDSYADYLRKVPRIIPNAKAFFNKDVACYLPLKKKWFLRELGSIVGVLLGVVLAKMIIESLSAGRIAGLEFAGGAAIVVVGFLLICGMLVRDS